jgi:hypothetical protein
LCVASTRSRALRSSMASSDDILDRLIAALAVRQDAYHVMPDLSRHIEKFSGEESPAFARSWIESLDTIAITHGWPDEFRLETAKQNLVGPAKLWLKSKQSSLLTYELFASAFKKTFVVEESTSERWRRLHQRKQDPHETALAYMLDSISLCALLNLSYDESKPEILRGLSDTRLRGSLAAMTQTDTDDLLHQLRNLQYIDPSMDDSRRVSHGHRNHNSRQQTPSSSWASPHPRSREHVNSSRPPTREDSRGADWEQRSEPSSHASYTSHGSRNHDSSSHPRPMSHRYNPETDSKDQQQCFRCRKYGHVSYDCHLPPPSTSRSTPSGTSLDQRRNSPPRSGDPQSSRSLSQPSQGAASSKPKIPIAKPPTKNDRACCVGSTEGHLPIVPATLDSAHTVQALCDSGSQVTLLRLSDLSPNIASYPWQDGPLNVAGGLIVPECWVTLRITVESID